MSRAGIDTETYERLVVAFRDLGPKPYKAAERVGIDGRTATRAYHHGWPLAKPPRRPIRDIIAEEYVQARADAAKAAQDIATQNATASAVSSEVRELARQQATQAMAEEAELISRQRQDLMALQSSFGHLREGAGKIAKVYGDYLTLEAVKAQYWLEFEVGVMKGTKDPERDKPTFARPAMGASALNRLLEDLRRHYEGLGNAFHQCMVMERLHVGSPTEIHGFEGIETDSLTPEQALSKVSAALEAVQALQSRRQTIDVQPDGNLAPLIGQRLSDG